jgi:hypothetical protein
MFKNFRIIPLKDVIKKIQFYYIKEILPIAPTVKYAGPAGGEPDRQFSRVLSFCHLICCHCLLVKSLLQKSGDHLKFKIKFFLNVLIICCYRIRLLNSLC